MATMRRETKKRKLNRLTIARIEVAILFTVLVLVGFAGGILVGTKTAEPKTETVIETIEVPAYQKDELPVDTEVYYFDVPLSHNLQKYIYEICADEEVPVTLVMAMVEHESMFNPEEVSDTDDYGLMQINSCNHEMLEESYRAADMLNPYQNVFCGVKIISQYIEKYGDYEKALMAYNMGSAKAKKLYEQDSFSSYAVSVSNRAAEIERAKGK